MPPPEGWTTESLGDRIQVDHGFAFDSRHFNTAGVGTALLTPANFYESGGFRALGSKQKYYAGEIPNGFLLEPQSLLVVMTEQAPGLIGSAARMPSKTRFLHNQRLGLVRKIDPSATHLGFVEHLFNSYSVRRALSISAAGTKVRHSSPSKIQEVQCVWPPFEEQELIARILSTADRLRRLTETRRDAARRQKRALLGPLLSGSRRFPEFRGEPWRHCRLRDVAAECNETGRGALGRDRVMGVTKTRGIVPMEDRLIGDVARYQIVRKDWFAYNPMRLNIGSIARWRDDAPVLVSPDYVVFRCLNDELDPGYLDQYRRAHQWRSFMQACGAGSVRVRIYFNDLGRHKMHLPPIDEQQRIAEVLSALDREIKLLTDLHEALQEQKKGLMQRLLTGKVRVPKSMLKEAAHA